MSRAAAAAAWAPRAGIAVLAAAILIGPLWAPEGFSWIRHTTSEQAGQGQAGAWIIRTGFAAYGLGVLVAAGSDRHGRPPVRAALAMFGLGLLAAALWSNAPVAPGLPADPREDWLHSVASGVVGTAFALACAARIAGSIGDRLAWAGLLVAVAVPLLMAALPEIRGLMQRAMFGFSVVLVLDAFPGAQNRSSSRRM